MPHVRKMSTRAVKSYLPKVCLPFLSKWAQEWDKKGDMPNINVANCSCGVFDEEKFVNAFKYCKIKCSKDKCKPPSSKRNSSTEEPQEIDAFVN